MVTGVSAPLSGIRVVDFTRFVSGAYASQLLAGLGAEVLKIEVPPNGDPYRDQGAARVGDESVLFMALNSAKKSVAIDFRAPEAFEHVQRLIGSADILIENARPGSMKRYGLDYDSVRVKYPHIVYGSITGFGDTGPDAQRGGFDLILQAESGLMSVTGHRETGPAKVGAPVMDVGAGLVCVAGITAALFERVRTGRGRHVSTSLLEFALASLSTLATSALLTGDIPGLLGTHSPTFAPYGAVRASDGWFVLAGAGSEDLWARLCRALDREDLLADARFVDNASRVANRDDLNMEIESTTGRNTVDHWLDVLRGKGIPCTRIADVGEAFSTPQVDALRMVESICTPSGESFSTIGIPVRFDGRRPASSRSAPRLGEHTRETLVSLGISDVDIADLVSRGVAVV